MINDNKVDKLRRHIRCIAKYKSGIWYFKNIKKQRQPL